MESFSHKQEQSRPVPHMYDLNSLEMQMELPENLIIEDNTVYVIDLECMERRRKKRRRR